MALHVIKSSSTSHGDEATGGSTCDQVVMVMRLLVALHVIKSSSTSHGDEATGGSTCDQVFKY